MVGFIYGLFDPSTDGLRYVGMAVNPTQRLQKHLFKARRGDRLYVCSWIRSLSEPPVMRVLDETDLADLPALEAAHIATLRATGSRLTNLTDGGEGTRGHRHTPEARARWSVKRKGRKPSPETRARMSRAHSLRKRPKMGPEWCKNISEAKKGQKPPPKSEAGRQALSQHAINYWVNLTPEERAARKKPVRPPSAVVNMSRTKREASHLAESDVESIRSLAEGGWPQSWIAEVYGISQVYVSNLKLRKRRV